MEFELIQTAITSAIPRPVQIDVATVVEVEETTAVDVYGQERAAAIIHTDKRAITVRDDFGGRTVKTRIENEQAKIARDLAFFTPSATNPAR